MVSSLTKPLNAKPLNSHCLISGEKAATLAQLPPIWQAIAQGKADVGISDAQAYLHLAQLFLYKFENGDVDLFQDRPHLQRFQPMFGQLLGPLAWETLAFYGEDFLKERYPNFPAILNQAKTQYGPDSDAVKVAQIGLDLFNEFGYDLPASFYDIGTVQLKSEALKAPTQK